jgi:hypothetical protein
VTFSKRLCDRLIARHAMQRWYGTFPRLIRCASRGRVTTYRLKGSRQTWDVKAETLSMMEIERRILRGIVVR